MYGAAIASLISYVLCGIMFVTTFIAKTHIPFKDVFFIKKTDVEAIVKKITK